MSQMTPEQVEAAAFARQVLGAYDHGVFDQDPDFLDLLLDTAEQMCDEAGLLDENGALR